MERGGTEATCLHQQRIHHTGNKQTQQTTKTDTDTHINTSPHTHSAGRTEGWWRRREAAEAQQVNLEHARAVAQQYVDILDRVRERRDRRGRWRGRQASRRADRQETRDNATHVTGRPVRQTRRRRWLPRRRLYHLLCMHTRHAQKKTAPRQWEMKGKREETS